MKEETRDKGTEAAAKGRMVLQDTPISSLVVKNAMYALSDKFVEVMKPIEAFRNILADCNRNDVEIHPLDAGVVLEALCEWSTKQFEAEEDKQHEAIGFQYAEEGSPPWQEALDAARQQMVEHFEANMAGAA